MKAERNTLTPMSKNQLSLDLCDPSDFEVIEEGVPFNGNWANPLPISSAKNDPALNELARLGIATPVPPKNVKLGRKTVELLEAERTQFAEYEGHQPSPSILIIT